MLLTPRHLARYRELGTLLVKHRRFCAEIRSEPGREDGSDDAVRDAERLAADLEAMGPTFVKLGQLLSTRADLLPPAYLDALSRLQDNVSPFPFDAVADIVTRELGGVRLSKAFARFDERPLASASLGQVHRAELRDGRPVAVKVQRPNIRERIVDDMEAIASIARFADAHTEAGQRLGFVDMVDEFRRSLVAELDYRREASSLDKLATNLDHHPLIVVPRPVADYTTGVVLTMEYVEGRNLGAIGPLGLADVDGAALARELFSAYLDQILVDGFFHADPHPGNVRLTADGKLALLDLGMVATVAPATQDSLIKLLLAVARGDGQDAADVAVSLGRQLEEYDGSRFRREAAELIGRHHGSTIGEIQAGAVLGDLTRIAGGCGLRLPRELTMLGKALLNLDEVVRVLDPTFEPNAAILGEISDLMRRKVTKTATPGHLMAAAMEAKEFAERLPARVNKVMDALAEGELKLNVQGIDEKDIMRSAQKLANRITSGVVIASLVIGAALIVRVPTSARLFGYPALAIVLFLVAAAAATSLLVSIQLSDLPQRRRRQ